MKMARWSLPSKYLIKFFADSAGKKGVEFYTPGKVVRLLVQVVKPRAGREVDDPTMGSGGFLIQSHQSSRNRVRTRTTSRSSARTPMAPSGRSA